MKLQIKNIGLLEKANINFNGLTVIAGENDTGKSTIGKLIFSIIKASSRYKEDLEENKEHKITSLVDKTYFQLRRKIDFSMIPEIKESFFPPNFYKDIDNEGKEAIEKRIELLKNIEEANLFQENFLKFEKSIKENLEKLEYLINTQEDKKSAQKNAFKKALISEFRGRISNENVIDSKAQIKLFEGKNEILNTEIKKNEIITFDIKDDIYFLDATLIESPILLQLSEAIDYSKTYFDKREERRLGLQRPNVPLHIKDLNDKLKISFYEVEEEEGLEIQISNVMKGDVKYSRKERDFAYVTKEGKKFSSLSTATGIKAFGIIQMLLKNALLHERTLLIVDEPEVHLHPKWQIKYAEFIVQMVKKGIYILVTSHSPYMIEALYRFSEKQSIEADIYLAENGCIEKTEGSNSLTLSNIFKKLSEPFEAFEEMDMDKLVNG